ncbi:MAG: hypothetical protein HN368_22695, partial [Spirochaetales bacterium]|nr:hypothetical protein [Spirochaetales bacterium]
MNHPKLLLTEKKTADLRSVDEVRSSLTNPKVRKIWDILLSQAQADLTAPPYTPATMVPDRIEAQAEAANRDYVIVHAAASRIQRAALVGLLTGESRFKEEAIRQLECIYDDSIWPDWRDMAHLHTEADLRTGQFMRAIGFAYDWLYPSLSSKEGEWIIAELDRRGIQPYLKALASNTFWIASREPNNWMTCIVGGAGIAGMAFGADHPSSNNLTDLAVSRMEGYLNVLGSEGEHNESIGYSGAMRFPIEFFSVHRYWLGGGDNKLLSDQYRSFCNWYMHFIVPPGVNAPFGDSHLDAPPFSPMFATMAAALQEPAFQWFYENHHQQSLQG